MSEQDVILQTLQDVVQRLDKIQDDVGRLDKVEGRLDKIQDDVGRLDKIEGRLDKIDDELEGIKARVAYVEHDPRQSTLRDEPNSITGAGVAGAGQDDYFEPWP